MENSSLSSPKKKTMTVAEMAKILGICKTESYFLLHHNYFETITVNKKTRIIIESFEKWYAQQRRYRKVNGEEPGSKLSRYMTITDIADILNISFSSASYIYYEAGHFKTVLICNQTYIRRKDFEKWYQGQSYYKKRTEQE